MIGRTCTGDVKIYWSKAGGPFRVAASESEFGAYKILRFLTGRWYFQELEMRADGLYFNLMLPDSSEYLSSFPGYGGSYKITNDGKLETIVAPKATIVYKDTNNGRRTAQVLTSSIPFPKNDGGEHLFLRVASNGINSSGIFSRIGTEWTLVLPFQVSPIPGLNAVYGLGQTFYSFGINEALDGTLSFMQGWATPDGSYREWTTFNPKTKALSTYYRYGQPILGVISSYFPTVVINSETRTRYWSLPNGINEYVVEAPNPGFKPSWKWILPSSPPRGSMRGASDYIASHVLTSTDFQQIGAAIWDGKQLQTLVLAGDILGGNQVNKIGGFAPVSGCTMWFTTSKPDDTVQSFWKFEKPCITDAVADSAQVVLYGKNLAFTSYPLNILVDGVPVSGATITADRINIPSTGIPGGTRTVQVKTVDGKMYSNETSVSVPITIPAPSITSVVSATFENRPIAPGAWFSIRGNNISCVAELVLTPGVTTPIVKPGETFRLPTLLGCTKVLINDREIPLNFSSCGLRSEKNPVDCQVNAQMPVGVVGSSAKLVIQRFTDINGYTLAATSQEFTVPLQPTSPTVLAIINYTKRGERVTDETPVGNGDLMTVYLTGFGQTSPVIPEGVTPESITGPENLALISAQVDTWFEFTSNGNPAYYIRKPAGSAVSPGSIGLAQVNIQVPDIEPDAGTDVFFAINIGGAEEKVKLPYLFKKPTPTVE